MSRITIDVTDQQQHALKAIAALEGKSIKQYALERLFPSDEQQAMQVRISAHRDRRFRDRDRTFRPMMTAHFG
jgi:uncharacterized protein (DUF1778 family)